ncbi:MAG TPA: sulfotransferase [Candidatus Nitrosopolaris sp.]|nr:sulfotransferase [Candidatus Nitrosopolaris sp.]
MIRDPVIVLGAPRSGTSMLFETLARSSQLWSLTDESHEVLEGPYHPRLRGWESNVLAATDLDPTTADRLRLEFEVHAQPGTLRRAKQDRRDSGRRRRLNYALVRFMAAVRRRRAGPVRLLEKTPKNCLRIPFLRALFPDARFVFLRRDGRATISSLIEGWQAGGRYESYRLPEPLHIAGHEGQGWCFLLPPGWRQLARASLEEVCAAQWLVSTEAVLATLDTLRAERRVYELAYEQLVARPRESLAPLLEFLGIPFEPAILAGREQLRLVNVVSAPESEKWRRRNGAAIERILPRIAAAQRALGY